MPKVPLFDKKFWPKVLTFTQFLGYFCQKVPIFQSSQSKVFSSCHKYHFYTCLLVIKIYFLSKFLLEADFPKIFKNKGIVEIRKKFPYLSQFLESLTFPYLDPPLYNFWTKMIRISLIFFSKLSILVFVQLSFLVHYLAGYKFCTDCLQGGSKTF